MIFLLLILTFSLSRQVTSSTVPIKLEFLKGITRLNTTGYTDFYFFCSVKGQFLLWELNDERLTGFEVNDEVGRSLVNKRFNYVYTGALLSSAPAENGLRIMGSIIVVSFGLSNPSNFEVTCSNGSHSQTTVAGPVTRAVNSSVRFDSNRNIILDYISSSTILRNRHVHIFICGANYSTQVLQANGVRLAFRSAETLGNSRVASASAYTINEQGILVAREPVPIVSILIVALDTDVEVICYNGNVQTRLRSNMVLDAELRNSMESVIQPSESADELSESATSSPAYEKAKPTPALITITSTTLQDRTDSKNSTKMNKNHKLVYAVAATSVFSIVVIFSTMVFLGVILIWCCRAVKNKDMIKALNMELPYDYDLPVKQESSIGNEEKPKSLRDMSTWKQIISYKMRPSVKLFSRSSFIMLFKPLQAQAEEVLELKTSQIQAIHEGGSQFAGITTGKSMKQVYVKSDGETFESTQKSVVARQDNPSSYWKINGGLLKGLLSKYYTIMKFDFFKVRRSLANCGVAQVQEGGSRTAMSSGKLLRPFHIKSDGQTIAPIITTSLIRQTSHQTEDELFFDNPSEKDQCRRRHNARCQSESAPRSVSLTRSFS